MIIVFTAIALAMLIGGIVWYNVSNYAEEGPFALSITGAILLIIVIGCSIFTINSALESNFIDDRIAILEEENARIEENINVIVNDYKDFETETFSNLKPEDVILYASLYPELASNTLVQNQIELYTKNKDQLVELKNEKIDSEKAKWWLYFGGN